MKRRTLKVKKQMNKSQYDPKSQSNYAKKAVFLARAGSDWGFNYSTPKPWKA